MSKRLKLELIVDDKGSVKLKKFDDTVQRSMKNASKSSDNLSSSFKSKLVPSIKGATLAVAAMAAAFVAWKTAALVKNSALAAARFETLGVVMEVVGRNAGRSAKEVHAYSEQLRDTGISLSASREVVIKLMQAHIDLTQATKLGRIAQDAAVIGNINSSAALERLVYGIQTAQTEVLKSIGITVNFERAYKNLADQLGKTQSDLSEAEKTQARLSTVMDKGKDIAGAYEAAMGTAGKKLSSFVRYVQDFKVEMGKAFGPALVVLVDSATLAMKDFTDLIKEPDVQNALKVMADSMATLVSGTMKLATLTAKLSTTLIPTAQNAAIATAIATGDDKELMKLLAEPKLYEINSKTPGAEKKKYDTVTIEKEYIDFSLLRKTVKQQESAMKDFNETRAADWKNTHEKMYASTKQMSDLSTLAVYEYNQKAVKLGEDTASAWTNAFDGWASDFTKTLSDVLWQSGTTFKDILRQYARMLSEMIIQKEIVEPSLAMFSGAAGGSSFLSTAFSTVAGMFGGGASPVAPTVNPSGAVFHMANGGVINEKVVGTGVSSGKSYEFGEAGPETVTPGTGSAATTINIYAADSKSFADMVSRNPSSIVTVIDQALSGNSSLRQTVQGVI